MEHLLSAWPQLIAQLRSARQVLLLMDFDGTLTPIVDKPEMANLAEETRRIIETLSRLKGFRVGIISGRALEDLKEGSLSRT